MCIYIYIYVYMFTYIVMHRVCPLVDFASDEVFDHMDISADGLVSEDAYVCMYVYIYIYIHTYIYTYIAHIIIDL